MPDCFGPTASGAPCPHPAGPSGYCPLHDPASRLGPARNPFRGPLRRLPWPDEEDRARDRWFWGIVLVVLVLLSAYLSHTTGWHVGRRGQIRFDNCRNGHLCDGRCIPWDQPCGP